MPDKPIHVLLVEDSIGDARLLAQHPELAAHYAAWAGELPRAEQEHG
ncbi:MAG TPA: hypothetical protein PLC79_09125 [Phycisphaerae bacterium]|nr:hypothetical protein [Phycisphaerae bacterium]